MSIASCLSRWIRRPKSHTSKEDSYSENEDSYSGRREFVYLDDVSVLSILASRTGGITIEYSENQTASQNSEVTGSLGVGLSGTKANLGTKIQASQVEASQVLRKSIIQTNFKELYDIERSALALGPPNSDHLPTVDTTLSLESLLGSSEGSGLLIDPSTLHRGDLLEVEVELEADPIFRMATIITTFFEMMEDNEELFENSVTTQLPEIRSVARLLESLLGGLVPIRGRLVDYEWIRICNRDVLVHYSLLCEMPADALPKTSPAFLVGVAQRDLFWKDIRRVLFSQARYTVFCRLAESGLTDRWNPVKMADVFSGIASGFDEMIHGLGGELMSGFNKGVRSATNGTTIDASSTMLNQDGQRGELLLRKYAESLADYHKRNIEPAVIEALSRISPHPENWLDSVDGYRPVFAEVTKLVDDSIGVETPAAVSYELRGQALVWSRLEETLDLDGSKTTGDLPETRCERFLASEIIAIYW